MLPLRSLSTLWRFINDDDPDQPERAGDLQCNLRGNRKAHSRAAGRPRAIEVHLTASTRGRSRIMARQAETLEINMELADIPGTSLKVSPVAIGTWAIGGWM